LSEDEIGTPIPKPDYEPMGATISSPPEDDNRKKTYSGESDGLREAAKDLTEARESQAPQTSDKTRVYQRLDTGEQLPEHLTIDPATAGRDVSIMRQWEAQIENPQPDLDKLQATVDSIREAFPARELPPTFVQDLQQAQAQAQESQPEPQSAQTEQPQPVDGLDPDIAQALQNPKIRQALEAEVQAAEQARVQYANAARQAAQLAGASLLASFPRISGRSK
jgi:hypothetical protein